MAKKEAETASLEEQREALETVLHSAHFQRAPLLAGLLSYLCEKLFAGDTAQIKEYSIGVDVFQRGSDYDQNSDSIVRVEANRLRKRLAEYYAGPGATQRLRIVIPLGQYVPQFEEAVQRQDGEKAAPAAARGSHKWIWWMAATIALLALGFGLARLIPRPGKQTVPGSMANPDAPQQTETQLGPPPGEEVRILSGSTRSFVDHAGKLWVADRYFEGGTAVKSTAQQIWRTQDPDFYHTSRQGQFSYAIPLKPGVYELHLYFAETLYGPELTGTGGEGSRTFSVRANGKPLLSHFDIVADSGASRTADMKVFTGISPAADGLLHLDFTGDNGMQAALSAIEILPGFATHIRPVRLLARQTPYYSNDSRWWSPDNYFFGGQITAYPTPVKGSDDPELYETERWGNFSYAIPVMPGKYTLTLLFAARPDEANSSLTNVAAAHVFDVYCNGNALLRHFDLAQEAHPSDVVQRRFSGLEPNAQGKLMLSFVPVKGYATVTGIEVMPE